MPDLRTRIAAALYEQRRSVSRVPILSGWAGAHTTVQKMWLAAADAVIHELNMQVEYDDVPAPVGYTKAHRYVTDWKADNE